MNKFNKVLAIVAIAAAALTACQNQDDDLLQSQQQAQAPELPAEIHIVSAEKMPADAYKLQTRATRSVTPQVVEGTYNGLLYDVDMNGKPKDDVENIKIDITAQGNNTFKFYLRPFRVGKMPGTLWVDIDNLVLNTDGTFYADEYNDYDLLYKKLHLKMGITFNYNVTLIDGRFTPVAGGYNLRLTLESRGTFINIDIFNAHVKYDGNQQ